MPDLLEQFPEYITFTQLRELCGIPRTSAYRYMKSCGFPQPIQLGPNAVRLRKSEVIEWIENRPPAPVHGSTKDVA